LPLAFKIFEVLEPRELDVIASKLKDYRAVEVEEVDGREVEVGWRVVELKWSEGSLVGYIEESFVVEVSYRGEVLRVPASTNTYFEFYPYEGRVFLILMAKKRRANRLASLLSVVLAARKDAIVEARIPAEKLRVLHESRPGSARVIYFDDLRTPNVEKSALYGEALADTELYQKYLDLGKVWYVVFEAGEGLVVGVTRNCVITVFSRVDESIALDFIKDSIIPLIQPVGEES